PEKPFSHCRPTMQGRAHPSCVLTKDTPNYIDHLHAESVFLAVGGGPLCIHRSWHVGAPSRASYNALFYCSCSRLYLAAAASKTSQFVNATTGTSTCFFAKTKTVTSNAGATTSDGHRKPSTAAQTPCSDTHAKTVSSKP